MFWNRDTRPARTSRTVRVQPKREARRLRLESLERRELMATDITSWIDTSVGVLYVSGTTASDQIEVRFENQQIAIRDKLKNESVPIRVTDRGAVRVMGAIDRAMVPYYLIISTSEGKNRVEVVESATNPAKPLAIYGGQDDDVLKGGSANDSIYGLGGVDSIYGNGGDDYLVACYGLPDELAPARGEFISGGEGHDTLLGGKGGDTLLGDAGNDRITGGSGNDYLVGGLGDDSLFGEAGNDSLQGNAGKDALDGGEGQDLFIEPALLTKSYLSNRSFYNGAIAPKLAILSNADSLAGIERATLVSTVRSPTINALHFSGPVDALGPPGSGITLHLRTQMKTLNFVSASAAINQKYQETAGMTDAYGTSVQTILGNPARDEEAAFNGGRVLFFNNGAIFSSPHTGTHVLYGDIFWRFERAMFEYDAYGKSVRAILGLPTSDAIATPNGGRIVHFQGGNIAWSHGNGAHAVYGAIRDKWAQTANFNLLGMPLTAELATPTRFGRYMHFQHGSLYWSPDTGAHVVFGAIRDKWAQLGWERGTLGFPKSDEMDVPGGGKAVLFERGVILWTERTQAHALTDWFAHKFMQYGGVTTFGYPTSDVTYMPFRLNGFGYEVFFERGHMVSLYDPYGSFAVSFGPTGAMWVHESNEPADLDDHDDDGDHVWGTKWPW